MAIPSNINTLEKFKFVEDSNGDVRVRTLTTGSISPAGLSSGGKVTEVTLNDSTWTALPLTALANRNAISIINNSGTDILINYDNTAIITLGIPINNGSERYYDITDSIIIYGISTSGSCNIIIEELS